MYSLQTSLSPIYGLDPCRTFHRLSLDELNPYIPPTSTQNTIYQRSDTRAIRKRSEDFRIISPVRPCMIMKQSAQARLVWDEQRNRGWLRDKRNLRRPTFGTKLTLRFRCWDFRVPCVTRKALISRIRLWAISYYNYNKEPPE